MDFDLSTNSIPYDSNYHKHCVSNLKEYGSYYQITVSKMINDLEREPMTDFQKELVSQGLTRSDARFFEWCMRNNRLDVFFPRTLSEKKFSYMGLDYQACMERLLGKDSFSSEGNQVDLSGDYEGSSFDGAMLQALTRYIFGSDDDSQVYKPDHVGRYLSNILRARKTLDELGNCNVWDYFVTFTIAPDKFDRHDFKLFYKSFSVFLQNCKRDYGFKMKYVFVPEQHTDGAWHLHGLVSGVPVELLALYKLSDYYPFTDVKCPQYILDKLRQGDILFHWSAYEEKFGYCVFEKLRSSEKAANYITKYIGKGFIANDAFKNVRLILPSLGLKRAVKIKKGFTSIPDIKPSYDCVYATTFKFPKALYEVDDVLKYFI